MPPGTSFLRPLAGWSSTSGSADSTLALDKTWSYNEKDASESGNVIDKGHCLIEKLFER